MKSQLIKNQIIPKDFSVTFQKPKDYSQQFEKSQDTSQKIPLQSTQKKSSRIKQAKQLLAQKLRQVTPFQQMTQNFHQKIVLNDTKRQFKFEEKNLQSHFNPISKLTKQPFVRSKTCEQMRKQFSLKKLRKRNNSASKFSTPNTDLSQRKAQSTGINSNKFYLDQNTSNKKSNQKMNLNLKKNKIETNQFSLDPFTYSGHMIETFNKERIQKLTLNDPHKNKMKSKLGSGTKIGKHSKQSVDLPIQLNFPFKINTITKKYQESEIQSPLVLQASFKQIEQKFTPRLERYPLSGQLSQRKQGQRRSSGYIESIELSQQNRGDKFLRQPVRTLQESPQNEQQSNQNNEDTSQDYSTQSPYNASQYMQHPSSSLGYSAQQLSYPNQLVANLHMTNTILQQKLKLKQQQIEELNKNYSQLKTELIQVKSHQFKKVANKDQDSNANLLREFNAFKSKPPSYKPPHYLTNFDLQIVHSIDTTQNNSNQAIYERQNTSSLPSPRFCIDVQEEFNRQRQLPQQKDYQESFQHNPTRLSKFYKQKYLFESSLSQQVSQQFDSQEINYSNKYYQPAQDSKFSFKKSNFYQSQVKGRSHNQNKRDSLVYTLHDELSINQSVSKQISPSFFDSSQKKYSTHLPTEEMLLQSVTDRENYRMQSFSEDDRISQLSPIKPNEQAKIDISHYRYMKYKNHAIKPENVILDESFNKFDYFLTPQKDETNKSGYKDLKLQQEGLFEKAFSSIKKKSNQSPIDNLNFPSNPLQNTERNFVDYINQENNQN